MGAPHSHSSHFPIMSANACHISNLKMLKSLGAEGAIVGKALYTDDINLKQALAAFSQ